MRNVIKIPILVITLWSNFCNIMKGSPLSLYIQARELTEEENMIYKDNKLIRLFYEYEKYFIRNSNNIYVYMYGPKHYFFQILQDGSLDILPCNNPYKIKYFPELTMEELL